MQTTVLRHDWTREEVRNVYNTPLIDVLFAAQINGEPPKEEINRRRFYANLYVGIYHELEGNKKLALEHLRKAAEDHRIGHYMWDVARVHRDLLRKELEKEQKD